jgi:hypothetical protein
LAAKVISVFFILSLGLNVCFGQTLNKSNAEILEQDISAELEKFLFYPDLDRTFQFVFFVTSAKNSDDEVKFVKSVVRKTADKLNIRMSFAKDEETASTDSVYNKVKIVVNKLRTRYPKFGKNNFLGEKTLVRELTSDLDIEITASNNKFSVKDKILTRSQSEIVYDEYERYQTDEYIFTQSVPPDISFFESIFFPALVITVSAVAAVLFFAIRSN